VSEQLLTILKLCLLALLYLFFFRVLRAVWAELRTPAPAPAAAGAARAPARAAPAPATAPGRKRNAKGRPTELVATAPPDRAGTAYTIGAEVTVGRAGGCAISLPEDTFVSSLHARVFATDSQVLVEDLGSTNGTFVNQAKVTAVVPLNRGDRLRVGNTILEAR
jgi:pSer/pThr/pTyr-binding forkhead associated (FHA) protein